MGGADLTGKIVTFLISCIIAYVGLMQIDEYYIQPIRDEAGKKQRELAELENEISRLEALRPKLEELQRDGQRIRAEYERLRNRLPTQEQISELITGINRFSAGEGFRVAVNTIPPGKQTGLQTVELRVTLTLKSDVGGYDAFTRFLKWVRDQERILTVDGYTLRSDTAGNSRLEVSLSAPVDYGTGGTSKP